MRSAAICAGTLALFLLTGCMTEPAPAATTEPPQPTASTTPAAFEVSGLPTVADVEISSEQTNEEIAQELVKAFSDWSMSGANRAMYDIQFEGDNVYLTTPQYVEKIADLTDLVFEEALFGVNATNPIFQEALELKRQQHSQALLAHFQTYGTQNEAPFVMSQEFVSLQNVVERDDGTVTMYVLTVRRDNADQNIVEGTGNGNPTRANYVFTKSDGLVKIVEPPHYVDQ